jgi:phosphoglycolate phosphatase
MTAGQSFGPGGSHPAPVFHPLLLFDHDGVIVDSLDVFTAAFIDSCRMAGIEGVVTADDVVELFEDNVYASLRAKGAEDAAIRDAVGRAAGAMHRALPWLRPFPLMLQVLNELADARRVVVVTSNAEDLVRAFLDRHGIEGVQVAGAESGESKADKIARLLADHPGQELTWFVSDTAGDMREARLAGVTPLGVAWGWHEPARLLEAGAEAIADTPADLLGIVAPELKADFLGLAGEEV